ncbi:hypothetical protein V8B97DRAFT_1887601 [Scleroderma yunnanense]
MSLSDLGKNDISAEVQGFKDKLASQDAENAALRGLLLKREAELNEIKVSLNETVYKLSKEADRVLLLEGDLTARDAELKRERVSRENVESALASTQEKLRSQERTTKELEATMDSLSQHSQSSNAERRTLEGEKHTLEVRVRELQRLVQQHEAQTISSNLPRRTARPRSSSVTDFRLPALEQELSDCKAQLALKEKALRIAQEKLTCIQNELVKAENLRISIKKSSQERISVLLTTLEGREDEIEALKKGGENGNAEERENALLQRIEEDEAKIAMLERMLEEGRADRSNQVDYTKLQSQLKAQNETLVRCEEVRIQLLGERDGLRLERDTMRQEISKANETLRVTRLHLQDSETERLKLQTEFEVLCKEGTQHVQRAIIDRASGDGGGVRSTHPNESALASYVETLLQAIDRLRSERDALKRALEFSEIEYRITMDGYKSQIASLSKRPSECPTEMSAVAFMSHSHRDQEVRTRRLVTCAMALSLVIDNLQGTLESSQRQLSTVLSEKSSLQSSLLNLQDLIEDQKQTIEGAEKERGALQSQLDTLSAELSASEEHRNQSLLLVAGLETKVQSLFENSAEVETAYRDAHESFVEAEDRLAALNKSYEEVESERNSLSLQVTNMQIDLSRVQEELLDVQDRYNALRTQQLNGISSSDVSRDLKDHIQELEFRILRRTEQIGLHQHDIRRLETNMRLQEERIAEMTSELEVLAAEKEAMVEDCAEARESRDRAIERSEAAEEEVEKLEEQIDHIKRDHEAQLTRMTSEVERLTSHCHHASSVAESTATQLSTMEAAKAELETELQSLRSECYEMGGHASTLLAQLNALQMEVETQHGETRHAFVALAIIYRAWRSSRQQLRVVSDSTTSLQAQVTTLSQELLLRNQEVTSIQDEVQSLHKQLADLAVESAAVAVTNAGDQAEINRLHSEMAELQLRLQETAHELSRARIVLQDQNSSQEEYAGVKQELEQLKQRLHDADALHELHDSMAKELAEARRSIEEDKVRHACVENQLAAQIESMSERLRDEGDFQERLQEERIEHERTSGLLRSELEDTKARLELSQQHYADLTSHNEAALKELDLAKQDLVHKLASTEEQLKALHGEHQAAIAALEGRYRQESDLLASNLEDRVYELDSLKLQLEAEIASRKQAEEAFEDEIKAHENRHASAAATENERHQAIARTQQQLNEVKSELVALRDERNGLQEQITGLEAEIQRLRSLTRHLESRNRESESNCITLQEALEECQLNLARSEKAGKAAEVGLALQTTQQEKVVSALRRELAALQSADLRTTLAELEEKNREMDDLLRNKCTEIEGYDDRILETLKANKRLSAKVESLTRKVQTLQTKLASTKSQPSQKASPQALSSVPAPQVVVMPSPSHLCASPALAMAVAPISTGLPYERSSVFPSLATPERRSETAEVPPVSAGMKRRAPDDDERDAVPPEGHYPVDHHFRNTTPRMRRTLHAKQIGFTPVRNAQVKGASCQVSPSRRATTAVVSSHTITDVTNSPRTSSHSEVQAGKKKSWLGKVRSGFASQNTSDSSKPWTPRSNEYVP